MLKGRLVLDCSDRSGWLAGRLLADLGAEVVKLDARDTDRTDPGWQAYNVNKRPLDLDVTSEGGRRRFDDLVGIADIVIACYRPGTPAAAVFDYDRLATLNPQLIVVAISPFGLSGPRAQWKATDIELMAAGGAMSLAGEPDGVPQRVSVPQSYSWTGAQAAIGALIAINHRNVSGAGQLVDVSGQASVVLALAHAPTFWDIERKEPTRAGAYVTGRSVTGARYRVFWPCRDGYLNFVLYGGSAGRRTNQQLVAWMRETRAELGPLAEIDWSRFDPTRATQAEVDAIEARMQAFFATLTKREFLDGAHRREMLGYPIATVADIAEDPQLEARRFWQMVRGPDGVTRRHCGSFAVIDGRRPPLRVWPLDATRAATASGETVG
ncbi:MAG: CoA transferase [Alphaproteobacteria bacterium]|nr:CoA transferase [Alphaproteobacteria bacterium]